MADMAVRQRRGRPEVPPADISSEKIPNIAQGHDEKGDGTDEFNIMAFLRQQPVWILLAIASGACAAINGVFAKLTTTALTGHLATQLSLLLGLSPENSVINLALRGTFFGLNLAFNGVMWALFTAALTRGDSTTRVSIVNVSTNFFVTAILGWMVFGENLPVQWWIGAGLLAAGNVIIGGRDEGEKKSEDAVGVNDEERVRLLEVQEVRGRHVSEPMHSKTEVQSEEATRVKTGEEIDNPI